MTTQGPLPIPCIPRHLSIAVTRHGLMLCLNQDAGVGALLLRFGEYYEGEVTLFERLVTPGMVVVEAGANIGAHTLPLAKLVGDKGRVLAFEPQRAVFQILNANLAMNAIGNVHAYHEGLGAQAGSLRVPVMDYAEVNNVGGVALGAEGGDVVAIKPLDDYNLERLDFLKIDVEGMEIDVLKGADKSIAAFRPILYVENDKIEEEGKSEALNSYILSLGYRAWWHLTPTYTSQNYYKKTIDTSIASASANLLCIPKEKPASIALPEMTDVKQKWIDIIDTYIEMTKA